MEMTEHISKVEMEAYKTAFRNEFQTMMEFKLE